MHIGKLRGRVAYWQKRLHLQHWVVSVELVDHKPMGNRSAVAAIDYEDHYDYAKMEILRSQIQEKTQEEIDRLLVHELLHLHMRDLDAAIDYVGGLIDSDSYYVWSEAVEHAQEGFIERIARTIAAQNSK